MGNTFEKEFDPVECSMIKAQCDFIPSSVVENVAKDKLILLFLCQEMLSHRQVPKSDFLQISKLLLR